MKKVLSLLLSLFVILGMLSLISVSANDGDPIYITAHMKAETDTDGVLTVTTTPGGSPSDYCIPGNCFDGNTDITEAVIGNGVTQIGARAFSSCVNIKKVTLPSSVTRVDSYAFADCFALNSFTVYSPNFNLAFNCFSGVDSIELYAPISWLNYNSFNYYGANYIDFYEAPAEDPTYDLGNGTALSLGDICVVIVCALLILGMTVAFIVKYAILKNRIKED